MRRISSRSTFYYKRVFPIVWFGFLIIFIAVPMVVSRNHTALPIPFLIFPIAMMAFGFFIMKKLVFNLVDEVWEDGDMLVVRNRGLEERIAFSDIKNVNYSAYVNPPRVTLLLRRPTAFGDEISFGAPVRFIPFATSPIIDDLIQRVDAARQRRA